MQNLRSRAIFIMLIITDAAVPILVWPYGHDYYYYPKITAIYVLLSFIILAAASQFYKGKIKPELPDEFVPAFVFILLVLLSASFSHYKVQSFFGKDLRREGALAFIAYFLMMYFTYLYTGSKKKKNIIIGCIFASSVIISIIALLQYFGIDLIPKDSIRSQWKNNSFSTLGNQNFLGSYLCLVLPPSLCLFLYSRSRKNSIFLFVITVLLYAALVCSRTRSAWVGAAISTLSVLFFLWRKPGTLKRVMLLSITFVLVTVMLNSSRNNLILNKFRSIVSDYKVITETDDTSKENVLRTGSERLFIWNRSMEILFDRPILGSGPDTFDRVFRMTSEEAAHYFGASYIYVDKAHNNYLQIAVTMGFPALLSYLLFLFVSLKSSIRNIVHNGNEKAFDILALSSGLFAYMIQEFFNISVVSVAPLFWSLMGLLAAYNEKVQD